MDNDSSSASRIACEVQKEIHRLLPGQRIPSQRSLVERYGVSASTVAQAIAILSQQGLVDSRPGTGSFKAYPDVEVGQVDTAWQQRTLGQLDRAQGASNDLRMLGVRGIHDTLNQFPADVIDLNGGYLHPDLRPTALLSSASARISKRAGAWNRPEAGGIPELRDWFSKDISLQLGRSDILISSGGQAALATCIRALTQPGDEIIVEAPTYPGTLAAVMSAGTRPLPLSLDEEGIQPDELEEVLKNSSAKVIVIQPLHQNPTGITMSTIRRAAILRLAYNYGAFIIEDDFARYLSHADAKYTPLPLIDEDRNGCVVHIRSLTKPTSPNLRIAAIGSRGAVTDRIRDALTTDCLLVPAILQYTALEIVTSTAWRRKRRELALELQKRRSTAVTEIARLWGSKAVYGNPRGGYHLWVRTPSGQCADQFSRDALARGVAITPGGNYYLNGFPDPSFFRLSYVTAPNEIELRSGIKRLFF